LASGEIAAGEAKSLPLKNVLASYRGIGNPGAYPMQKDELH
jgi:hypothetical protein